MTETLKVRTYNKARWGEGEWTSEPDRVDFTHKGFSCFVLRNDIGVWCGYVGVPKGHPAYEKKYTSLDVDVHGGLTYSDKCAGSICHIPVPGMPDDVWWLGFDCGHSDDVAPGFSQYGLILSFPGSTYKNLAYVTEETRALANQLAS